MTVPTADKPVRHILALSGGKAASCVRALDMFLLVRMEASCRDVFDGMKGMT